VKIRPNSRLEFALIRKIRVYGNRNHPLFAHSVCDFSCR